MYLTILELDSVTVKQSGMGAVSFEYDSAADAMIDLMQELTKAEEERDQLQARIDELESLIKNAPVSSGVFCCGESMSTHPEAFIAGHDAVDEWDYHSKLVLDRSTAQSLARRDARVKAEALQAFRQKFARKFYDAPGGVTMQDFYIFAEEEFARLEAEAGA